MKISVLFFEGCPNHAPTVERARSLVVRHGLDAEVEEIEVSNLDDVERLRFLGSPTLQVDGLDIEPAARERTDFAMSCRVYKTPDGLPSQDMLRAALGIDQAERPDGLAAPEAAPQQDSCCTSNAGIGAVHDHSVDFGRRPVNAATAGSVVAAILSSACCWLPLVLIAFGASAAGVAGIFEVYRPYFVVVAVALLGLGFYLVYFRKGQCAPGSACAGPNRKLLTFNHVMLWTATALVAAFVFFPSYVGVVVGSSDRGSVPADDHDLVSARYHIEGMTCEGCAQILRGELAKLPGAKAIQVDYATKSAVVRYHPDEPVSPIGVIKAAKAAGYSATRAEEQP